MLIRYGFFTDEMMVCLILNGEKLPAEEKLVASLREIPEMASIMVNVNKKRNNVILGETVRLLWGYFFKSNSGINSIDYNASSGQLTIINEKQKIIYQREDPGFDVFKVFE